MLLQDIKLEYYHDNVLNIRKSISKIDQTIHVLCIEEGIEYRVDTKLGDICRYPYFNGIHFRKYVGEGLNRTDFLISIWSYVETRADLVMSYRSQYANYTNIIETIRGEK